MFPNLPVLKRCWEPRIYDKFLISKNWQTYSKYSLGQTKHTMRPVGRKVLSLHSFYTLGSPHSPLSRHIRQAHWAGKGDTRVDQRWDLPPLGSF